MFKQAYEVANKFTFPVIASIRYFDKTVECALGSFVILNEQGWIVTVAHLFEPHFNYLKHQDEIKFYHTQVTGINNNSLFNAKQKQKNISKLKVNPKWITQISYWWGKDGRIIPNFNFLLENDLAIGRIANFNPKEVTTYPVIKDMQSMQCGTSLCKLGFPFHNPKSTFDEATGNFKLEQGTFPIPYFPIEGIFTRNIYGGKSNDGKYDITFLETSSPGLRGQSGGPIFDTKGTVWAIQSRTSHLPLGFTPKVIKNGKEVEENQFLNVGLGIHPLTLVPFLRDNGVDFQLSDY